MRTVCLTLASILFMALAAAAAETPDVLVIDDFEKGIDRWENQDTGKLEWVDDAPQGKKALRWTASDDGIGHIVLKRLDRREIDFSQYQLLSFRIKIEGKPAWNVNPIVQQAPAVFGYRGLYYSIDTLMPFGEWFEYTQDLRRWENAWPDTYSADKQEFQFEIAQLAGSGNTRVYLDDIRLLKNPLGLERSYAGAHSTLPDGSQVTTFRVVLTNRGTAPLTVAAALRKGSLEKFRIELPQPTRLLPGQAAQAEVRVTAPAGLLANLPAWYGETAIVGFSVQEVPGLALYTELAAGTRPKQSPHPCILGTPDHVKRWQAQWADPAQRAKMDRAFQQFVARAEAALTREPAYPWLAHTGLTQCPKDGARLAEVDVPDAPFHTYQCRTCGQAFSGPLFDAGMQGWLGEHLRNAGEARDLAFAYAITGRPEFAAKAAAILRRYVEVYPKLPNMSISQGSPVFSHTSGSTPIGGTFMRQHVWLTNLAIALDFIRSANVVAESDLEAIGDKVFVPAADVMLDHKVGAMNLQWMIASAGLFAGLAADRPGLVARSMYDPHGIRNLMRVGYLPDGNWWENPSYQNVCNGIAFPVLATCLHNGILPWEPRMKDILLAPFRVYGPDGRSPTLGTGSPGSVSYSVNALHSLAGMLKDPELAWVPYHHPMWRATSSSGQPYDSYLWALTWQEPPAVPEAQTRSPIPTTTTLLPDYGGIAMRLPGSDAYCYFNYGRELVHGHRNKLSINAYAKGGWFVRNVAGGYGDNFKNFLETIASSTSVMVDGGNADWDTGELLFHRETDNAVLASAREVGAWKDVEHERSIVFTGGPLIVLDRLKADRPHRYDWLYQSALCKLDLVRDGLRECAGPLGETPLYESLVPDRSFGQPRLAAFVRADGSGLKLAFLPAGDLFSFKALGKTPGLLWRQEGASVGFAAAYWPHAKGEQGTPAIEPLPVMRDGAAVGLEAGQAVRVTTPEGNWTVLVNYTGKPLTCAGISSSDRVACQASGDKGRRE